MIMKCDVCRKDLLPLDAHMGMMNKKLVCVHIDCWNKHVKNIKPRLRSFKNPSDCGTESGD